MCMPGKKMKRKVSGYYHKKEQKETKNILKAEYFNNQFHVSHFFALPQDLAEPFAYIEDGKNLANITREGFIQCQQFGFLL